jgi:hypothetical protein
MKNYSIFVLPILLLIISCTKSKDQKVVDTIEGSWKVVDIKKDGVQLDPSDYKGITYKFESCKVTKEDCPGTVTYNGWPANFKYSVSEEGTKITAKIMILKEEVRDWDILEYSKVKMILRDYNDNGKETITTFEKL